jgi:hypothetical protein
MKTRIAASQQTTCSQCLCQKNFPPIDPTEENGMRFLVNRASLTLGRRNRSALQAHRRVGTRGAVS